MSDEKDKNPAPKEHGKDAGGHSDDAGPAWSPDWLESVTEKKPDAKEEAAPEEFSDDWLVPKEPTGAALPPVFASDDDLVIEPLPPSPSPSASSSSDEVVGKGSTDELVWSLDHETEAVPPVTSQSSDEVVGKGSTDDLDWSFDHEREVKPPIISQSSDEVVGGGSSEELNWSGDVQKERQPLTVSGSSDAVVAGGTSEELDWSVDDDKEAEPPVVSGSSDAIAGGGPSEEFDWSVDDDKEAVPPIASGSADDAFAIESGQEQGWSGDAERSAEPASAGGPTQDALAFGGPVEVHWPATDMGEYDVEGPAVPPSDMEIVPPPPRAPAARPVASEPPRRKGSPLRLAAAALGVLIAAVAPAAGVFFLEQNKIKASEEAHKAAEQQKRAAEQLAAEQRKRADDLAQETETLKADLKTAKETAEAAALSAKAEAEKEADKTTQDVKNQLAEAQKQLEDERAALKKELDAEKGKREQAEQAATKAQRIAEEALADAKKPAPAAAKNAEDAVAAIKQAEEPAAVSQGLERLIRAAFDANDPEVLENAASGLGDRADALIKACQEASAKEQDPKVRARYDLFELLLHEENDKHAAGKDAERQGRTGRAAPGAGRLAVGPGGTAMGRRVRTIALRAALAPGDSVERLKEKIALVDRVIKGDPDELSAYLRKGRLFVELGRKERDAGRNDESLRAFDEAAKAFREGLNRLKQTPTGRDRGGKIALGLSEGFNDVLTSRPAQAPPAATAPSPAPAPGSEAAMADLKAARAQLESAQTALNAARAQLKTALAERDEARRQLGTGASPQAPRSGVQAEALPAPLGATETELAAVKAACDEANRALARLQSEDRRWAQLGVKAARLVGLDRPLPDDDLQRAGWIHDLAGALENRLIEGTAPPEPVRPRTEDALAAYSTGLELLYRGDERGAIQKFSEAIRWDPRDARFFYFRGIAAYLASHGGPSVPADAVDDVRRGVALERQNLPSSEEVGRALVRIQNGVRHWVESIRHPARQVPASSVAAETP